MDNSKKLSEREIIIFLALATYYIHNFEPVGSRTLSKKLDIELSPASIRNVMADLEEKGFLTHPHTSAGRIPTEKGYRFLVNHIMECLNKKKEPFTSQKYLESLLIQIKERDFNYDAGTVLVKYSKTGDPKLAYFLDEDLQIAKSFGPAFPELYFFRHAKGIGGVTAGSQFVPKYLWKWWKRACRNLGIEGVDLYGGTRHSTVRHLAQSYSPEEIKQGGWKTNKAFDRYLGPVDQERKREIYRVSADNVLITDFKGSRKANVLKSE